MIKRGTECLFFFFFVYKRALVNMEGQWAQCSRVSGPQEANNVVCVFVYVCMYLNAFCVGSLMCLHLCRLKEQKHLSEKKDGN